VAGLSQRSIGIWGRALLVIDRMGAGVAPDTGCASATIGSSTPSKTTYCLSWQSPWATVGPSTADLATMHHAGHQGGKLSEILGRPLTGIVGSDRRLVAAESLGLRSARGQPPATKETTT
jgi:hypothetical protein